MPEALYRPHAGEPWQPVEIVRWQGDELLLREVDRLWPGVMLASPANVRVVVEHARLTVDEWTICEGAA